MPRILAPALGACLMATTSAETFDDFESYVLGLLGGQVGGVGFENAWEVQPGSNVQVVPRSGGGRRCEMGASTQGGAAWRYPDASALPDVAQSAQLVDRFGRDGSTLLITVTMQRPAASTAPWGGVSLFPGTYLGPERIYFGAINGTTALGFHDYAPGGAGTRVLPGTDLTNETVLVAEIRFGAGPEGLRVWADPPAWTPGPNPPASPPDLVETIGPLDFGSVRLAAGGHFRFDDLHLFDTTPGGQPLGTEYCGPAVPNATGVPATIQALGSQDVDDNDLQLICGAMPANTFGYFVSSRDAAPPFIPPGSRGNLCLGGSIGRHGPPLSTGSSGVFAAFFDLQDHNTPTGPVAVMPFQRWHFQAWFRDNQAGSATSNFTPGFVIDFF